MDPKIDREKYEVFVDNENILNFYGEKDPTEESARKILEEAAKLIKKHNVKRVFVDLSAQDLGKLPAMRNEMYDAMSKTIGNFKLEKVGITGTSVFLRVVCNFVFRHTKVATVKFFDTKNQALEWLQK